MRVAALSVAISSQIVALSSVAASSPITGLRAAWYSNAVLAGNNCSGTVRTR
eukprot:SAG31_NODE_16736_length_698_cov_0.896494_1_plen_52_part_00